MWSEEHRWTGSGWGTANQKGRIPAPTNLRTSEYRPGLMKLKYDWNGDEDQIEGFILYRSYNCPGRGDVIRAPLYSYGVDRHVYYSPWNEPAGCAYRYTMTAFGRYGESAPSQPLLGTTQSTFQAARVIFHKLKIHSLPDGSATGDIRLSVGPDHHTGSLWLQKKEYALDNLAMDGMIPNNRFGLILEKNADASIGFSVEMYDDQNRFDGDVCYGYISIKEEDLKKLTNTINHTISDTDNRCTVTLSITGLPDYSPPAGSRIMPQTDLYISKAYRTGYRVYAYVRRDYGDELDDARFLVQSSWGEYCESKPPLIYGTAERWVQGGGGYPPGLYYLDPKVDAFVNMVQTHPEKYSACPMKLLLRVTEGKPGDNPTFIDIDEANNENLIEISKIH